MPSAVRDKEMWSVLWNDSSDQSVMVPDFSPESVRRAADIVMQSIGGRPGEEPYEDDVATLIAKHKEDTWRQHTTLDSIEKAGCSCEDEGWWCPEGNGRRKRKFVWFEGSDLFMLEGF